MVVGLGGGRLTVYLHVVVWLGKGDSNCLPARGSWVGGGRLTVHLHVVVGLGGGGTLGLRFVEFLTGVMGSCTACHLHHMLDRKGSK